MNSDRSDSEPEEDSPRESADDQSLEPTISASAKEDSHAKNHSKNRGDQDAPAATEIEETLPPNAVNETSGEAKPGSGASGEPTIAREAMERCDAAGQVFGDYELIEELARGGMGVVYRARHRRLNRMVALKLVLSGQFASQEDITRFHLEAEAAAGLDHPGITPIYEIGNSEGQPFFAMKLITGGSVEGSIERFEGNHREAVELLSKVARAIHHAHERGILHRDLKPSNILLTEAHEPLVTDFGLAKIADRDSQQTRTGAIMGTPAYMAPEQAAGSKGVTTATDIYGLGAILYRLLTGRPTFVAESALDVVMKSINEEPDPPRSVNPDVPVDLELICMKCLSRNPLQRYSSAAAFADDLDRWLAGEVVSVRPASVGTLAGIWMKQNLQTAGSAAMVGCVFGLIMAALMWLSVYSVNFGYAAQVYDEFFPTVQRPRIAINWRAPAWAFAAGLFAWPTLIAICGLVTVLVTKPPTRSAAASVGMISGVICAVLMGIVGSVGPILSQTVSRTETDIRLLVQAAETDSDESRFAQDAIVYSYPDLEPYNSQERAELLRRKITSDLIVGTPTGLWLGMCVFAMVVPAIVMGAIFAWRLTRRMETTTSIWVRYIDVSFAFCLILMFGILFVASRPLGATIYVPELPQRILTLAALAVALTAAILSWKWPVRTIIHVIWIGCLAAYLTQSAAAPNAYQNAGSEVIAGNYQAALKEVEQSLKVGREDSWLLLLSGVLQAKLGQEEDYQRTCKRILNSTVKRNAPEQADRAAKLCLLQPRVIDETAIESQLAEKASVLGRDSQSLPWFQLVHAMAHYRSGRFQDAIDTVSQIDREYSFLVNGTADMVIAMCYFQLGDVDQAEKLIEASSIQSDQQWNEAVTEEYRLQRWHDRMIYEIWRDQAKQQIKESRSH